MPLLELTLHSSACHGRFFSQGETREPVVVLSDSIAACVLVYSPSPILMPISDTPKNQHLAAAVSATLRVNSGAGVVLAGGPGCTRVIVTAYHVVKDRAPDVILNYRGREIPTTVVYEDERRDVALVSMPADLEMDSIPLYHSTDGVALGDEVWIVGYPTGWTGTVPVVGNGRLAAVGPECWVNADSTWGNSGGPVVVLTPYGPHVVGIVLGRAGETHAEAKTLHTKFLDAEQRLSEEMDAFARRVAEARDKLSSGWKWPIVWQFRQLISSLINMFGVATTSSLEVGVYAFKAAGRLSESVDQHFRTGYVRMATFDDIADAKG